MVDRSRRVRVARPSRESWQPAKEMAGRPNRNGREGLIEGRADMTENEKC
jgi:hypothetical protein